MIGYIYKLVSPSGKCYIGQTINLNKRLSDYRTFHHCENQKKLFNAIKKYGFDLFTHEILDQLNEDNISILKDWMNEKEIYYITFYDSVNSGYNICYGGNQHRLGVKETEEQKEKKRNRWTPEMKLEQSIKFSGENNPRYGSIEKTYSKKVNQYNKNGEYIKTWESASDINKELGYSFSSISSVCRGKSLTAFGFIWKFYNNSIDNITPIESKRGKTSKKGVHTISILQFSKDNKFIKEFSSILDAEIELNICHTNISSCAKGKRKTAGGYIWKYKN